MTFRDARGTTGKGYVWLDGSIGMRRTQDAIWSLIVLAVSTTTVCNTRICQVQHYESSGPRPKMANLSRLPTPTGIIHDTHGARYQRQPRGGSASYVSGAQASLPVGHVVPCNSSVFAPRTVSRLVS